MSSSVNPPFELTDREQQINKDYEWGLNDPEVKERYAGRLVFIYRQKVWGVGETYASAAIDAMRHVDCPPILNMAKVHL